MNIHPVIRKEGADKQYATIDGYQIAYITQGDPSNPPLVMVHGWLYHAGMWRDLMATLSPHFYCIAVDMLGHGHSDKPNSYNYSIDAASQHVLTLMDQLGYKRFIYIGHSMGGMIGLKIAARLAPERIIKLVDVDGVTSGRCSRYVRMIHIPLTWLGWLFPAMFRMQRFAMKFAWYRQILADNTIYYQRGLSEYDSTDIQMALIPGIEVPAKKIGVSLLGTDMTPYLKDITIPTLIIFGERDNTVPVVEGYLAAKHIPNSKLIIYEKCSHFPTVEMREHLHSAVCVFLEVTEPETETIT